MSVMFPYCDIMQMSQAASEVENMKSQMMTLFKELQQAQSKLDEAEGMKKNLQDRSGPYTQTHIVMACKTFSIGKYCFISAQVNKL